MGPRTLGEVQDMSLDPRGSPGWVRGPSGWSGMVRCTLRKVCNDSLDPQGGTGRVIGHSGRSGMGRRTLGEVRDG